MSFHIPLNQKRRSLKPIASLGGIVAALYAIAIPQTVNAQSVSLVEECNQFATEVNRNQVIMDEFESEIRTFSETAAAAETLDGIQAAATQYVGAVDGVISDLDALATDLETFTFRDEQLTTFRDNYVTVVAGFNEALSIVGAAMGNVAEAESEAELSNSLSTVQADTAKAVEQIEQLANDEATIIEDVNAYCGAS